MENINRFEQISSVLANASLFNKVEEGKKVMIRPTNTACGKILDCIGMGDIRPIAFQTENFAAITFDIVTDEGIVLPAASEFGVDGSVAGASAFSFRILTRRIEKVEKGGKWVAVQDKEGNVIFTDKITFYTGEKASEAISKALKISDHGIAFAIQEWARRKAFIPAFVHYGQFGAKWYFSKEAYEDAIEYEKANSEQ